MITPRLLAIIVIVLIFTVLIVSLVAYWNKGMKRKRMKMMRPITSIGKKTGPYPSGRVCFVTVVDRKSAEESPIFEKLVNDLGSDFHPVIVDRWDGFGNAFLLLIKKIHALPRGSLVVKTDASDVMMTRHDLSGFHKAFESFESDIVISGERVQRCARKDGTIKKNCGTHQQANQANQANAGFYAGTKEKLLEFMECVITYWAPPRSVSPENRKWDDQDAIQQFIKAGTPGFLGRLMIDTESVLVHTGAAESKDNYTKLPYGKVMLRGKMINPYFYHAPGGSKKRGIYDIALHAVQCPFFIRVGKTGGTEINYRFRRKPLSLPQGHLDSWVPIPGNKYFTIVRDPLERMISAFRMTIASIKYSEKCDTDTHNLHTGMPISGISCEGDYPPLQWTDENEWAEDLGTNPLAKPQMILEMRPDLRSTAGHLVFDHIYYFNQVPIEDILFVGRTTDLDAATDAISKLIGWSPTDTSISQPNNHARRNTVVSKTRLSDKARQNLLAYLMPEYVFLAKKFGIYFDGITLFNPERYTFGGSNPPVHHAYVINLPRRPDKAKRIKLVMAKIGLNGRYSIWPGYDASANGVEQLCPNSHEITEPGTIGCAYAHESVYNHIAGLDVPDKTWFFVFEDDAIPVVKNIRKRITEALSISEAEGRGMVQFGICGTCKPPRNNKRLDDYRWEGGKTCAHATAVQKKYADGIAASIRKDRCTVPCDISIKNFFTKHRGVIVMRKKFDPKNPSAQFYKSKIDDISNSNGLFGQYRPSAQSSDRRIANRKHFKLKK